MSPKASSLLAVILSAEGFNLDGCQVADFKTSEHTGEEPNNPEDTVLELYEETAEDTCEPDFILTVKDLDCAQVSLNGFELLINKNGEDFILSPFIKTLLNWKA